MNIMIFEQIKNSLKKDAISMLFLFLLFIISITLMMFSISFCYEANFKQKEISSIYDNNYYQVYDNYVGQEEEIFLNEKDNLIRLKNFYNNLSSREDFKYFTIINQPTYIQNIEVPDQFYYGFENSGAKQIIDVNKEEKNYHWLKCVQISKSVIEEFKLSIELMNDNIIENWDTINIDDSNFIPIILGANYKNKINLNEEYKMLYMDKFLRVKVIGFLEKNSNVYNNGNILYLDNYIILPSFNFKELPKNEKDKRLQLSIYLQKTSGVISSNLSANDIQKLVNEIAKECNLNSYSIKEADTSNIEIFNLGAKEFAILLLIISAIIVIFSTIGLSLTLSLKVEDNLNLYAVHLLVGANLSDIKKYIILEVGCIIGISIVTSILIAEFLTGFRLYCLKLSIIISIIIGILSCIYPLKVIKKISLNEILKRND